MEVDSGDNYPSAVGDVCHHWKTHRQGTVVGWDNSSTHFDIKFDDEQKCGRLDGETHRRRISAFVKGPSTDVGEPVPSLGWKRKHTDM